MLPPDLCRRRATDFPLHDINLREADGEELVLISNEMGLGLSITEMERVRAHFADLGRNPTDLELQALAQAWSEHCSYKSSRVFIKKHLVPVGGKGSRVLDRGDAGVMEFDEHHAYALRIESHNHPSAVEPYGGAATGIGGIVRDVLAMGAQPIALIDPLFFGPLDHPHANLPDGVKHPRYLFSGVVSGIRDYGNRIGVPTVAGSVYFHPGYLGNCLVNVGCIGFARREHLVKNRVGGAGDVFVLAGGLTGRDGIHGVTFASAVLTSRSEKESRGAVQLGDPITKEPLIHCCITAAREGLLTGLKDLGGGGLSCVVGEMANGAGLGAEVELDSVPLKERGMAPWEIWVSESQERMMLSVAPKNLDRLLSLFRSWDVPATPIGRAVVEPVVRVLYHGVRVCELATSFYVCAPEYTRPVKAPRQRRGGPAGLPPEVRDYGSLLLHLLSSPNIACRDWVIRQYDHEVKGATVVKPLQGRVESPTHGDAAVLKPLPDSYQGLAVAVGSAPSVGLLSPYEGGAAGAAEAFRNILSVGARPHSVTNCLNFGNPEKPERLWEFSEAVKGLGDVCGALGVPVPSGNVSFYNEGPSGAVPPTAVVLAVGIMDDVRDSVTTDLKEEGNPLYLLGSTPPELGGSEYLHVTGHTGGAAPPVDIAALTAGVRVLPAAASGGLVASCHDISSGGLGAAVAEMCIGGGLGAELDLSRCPARRGLRADVLLFSEGGSRWLVEVRRKRAHEFERLLGGAKAAKIGRVTGGSLRVVTGGRELLDQPVEALHRAWASPLREHLG